MGDDMVVLEIRNGHLSDSGSWIYLWIRPDTAQPVIYVGTTGLPPQARTWLHLHDPDPDIGRLRARYPALADTPLRVIALRLPDALPRPDAKAAMIAHLHAEHLLSESYVGDPPTDTPAALREQAREWCQKIALA